MTYFGSRVVAPLFGEDPKVERIVLGFANMILSIPCLWTFLVHQYFLRPISIVQLLANSPDACLTSFNLANLFFKIFSVCS